MSAQEALEALFDSGASPIDVANPAALAETIVAFLLACGFKITDEDEETRSGRRPMTNHKPSAERVLADLFGSADFPGLVPDPELAAKIVIKWLADGGLCINPASF
jgi:hypothetical protein